MDAQFARLDAKMNYDPNDFNDLDMVMYGRNSKKKNI